MGSAEPQQPLLFAKENSNTAIWKYFEFESYNKERLDT